MGNLSTKVFITEKIPSAALERITKVGERIKAKVTRINSFKTQLLLWKIFPISELQTVIQGRQLIQIEAYPQY